MMRPSFCQPARCFALLLLVAVVGCQPKGSQVNVDNRNLIPNNSGSTADIGRDGLPEFFPRAVDLRVHPATRYVNEDNELRLEARVELLDQFNDPVKDVGQLMLELRTLDDEGRLLNTTASRRDYIWTYDLTSRQSQQNHWDPIARSYILPLKIDARDIDLPNQRTVLLVTFQPAWPGTDMVPSNENRRKPVEIRRDW